MEEPNVYVSEMIERVFGEYRNQHDHLLKKYESAIRNYTGTKYASMNLLLRSKSAYLLSTYKRYKSIPDTVAALKKIKEYNKELFAFFNEIQPFIPTSHLILYRSVKKNIVDKLDAKGTHTDTAFTSVSTNIFNTMTMNVFNDDKNIYIPLRLHLLPGIEYKLFPINKISLVPEEEEILFAPPVKYYLCKHYIDYRLRINEDGESIRDCILIPDEPRYKKLLKDQKWLEKWSAIITQEEAYMFRDINTANIGKIYPATTTDDYKGVYIFKFIQQVEYLIDTYISRIHDYNDENAFPDINEDIQKIYSKIINSIYDARIKGDVEAQLSHYLEALNASIVKTVVPKSKFLVYGEWMKALAATAPHHGGAGTRNTVAPAASPELSSLLTHIVKDASINAMLNEWIKRIRDFLLHYGIPIEKVFELQPWFYDINICGYKPIRGAEDLDGSKFGTQREKVTLIYRFAMKLSGLLWHYVINGDNITQLPVFMNKEVLNTRMKHILEKHGKTPSSSGFVGNKQLLKEVYEGDRKLQRIYREFTIPNAVPTEEMYKKDRVSQTHAHYIHRGHLIEPLSASEESILQKTNSLFKRGVTAIRLRNVPAGDELPWITGAALYKVKRDSPFAKLAETYRKAVLTGPSGSTQLMLEFAKMFNMDERNVVLSLIPWMYIHQDHSIFEILLVANNYIGGYELTKDDQDYIKSLEGAKKPHSGGATQRSRPVSASPAAHRISYNAALKQVLRELKPIIDNAPPANKLTKELRDTLRNTQELLNRINHPIITSEDPMAIEAFMAYKFPDMDGVDYARLFGMQRPF